MIREEGRSEKTRIKMGNRAVRYEERLKKGGGRKLARKCWEKEKGEKMDRYGKNTEGLV